MVSDNNESDIENNVIFLYQLIETLNSSNKEIINFYIKGLSYAEISVITGIKRRTLRVRVNRIKESLKLIYKAA